MKASSRRVSEVIREKIRIVFLRVVLVGPLGVGVLEVVEQPEELEEDLGRLLALRRARDRADHGRDGGVA